MIPGTDASHLQIFGHPVALQGPLAVLGLIVGQLIFVRQLRHTAPISLLQADLLSFALLAAAVVSGHFFALALLPTERPLWQLASPQSTLGALLGAGLTGILLARRLKLPLVLLLDAAALAFAHGWPLVRLGCALAHDHPGRHLNFPLAVQFPDGPRLDLGLLEWLVSLLLLVYVRQLQKRDLLAGELASRSLLLFATARLGLELLRVDTQAELLIPSQLLAIFLCIFAILLGIGLKRQSRIQALFLR